MNHDLPSLVPVRPLPAADSREVQLISRRYRRNRGAAIKLSRPQHRLVAQMEERLRSGAYTLTSGACVCGDVDGAVIAQVDRYGLALDTVLCATCGTLRTDPYLVPHDLDHFYRHCYQALYARVPDPPSYFQRQRQYGKRLIEWARPQLPVHGAIAEVGCGAGGALSVFVEAGHRIAGCDYSEALVMYGRLRGVCGLQVGDIETLADARAIGGPFDLLLLHHVFEHLADPIAVLRQALQLISSHGLIVVAVPDVARCDKFRDKRGNLRLYLHVAHKFNFTLCGLHLLADRLGLTASVMDIEPDRNAPELWVAFGRDRAGLPAHEAEHWTNPEELYSTLRTIEREFVRRERLTLIRRRLEQSVRNWFDRAK